MVNDKDLIEGTFTTGITRSITNVSAGASVVTVDSTVGFEQLDLLCLVLIQTFIMVVNH